MSPLSHKSLPSLIHKIPQKPYIFEGNPAQARLGCSAGKPAYQRGAAPGVKAQRAPLSLLPGFRLAPLGGAFVSPCSVCVCVCVQGLAAAGSGPP